MIVIPADPFAQPPRERAEAAFKLLLSMRPEAQDHDLQTSEMPEFHHCGANLEGVYCPFCQADIQAWWTKAIGEWWSGEDRNRLSVETPCCGRQTSLNDLDYDSPQGFACLAMRLLNPGYDLEPDEVAQIAAALGVPLRVIWQRM